VSDDRRYVCLVSAGASAGTASVRLRSALRRAPGLAERCEMVTIRSRDDMRIAVRRLPADSIPVAAGGDGTVNWLYGALQESGFSDRPLAVLPLGTGNALAHSVGLGLLGDAVNALQTGEVRAIDIMRTTHPDAPFALISLSVGFESRLLRDVAAGHAWRRIITGALGLPRAAAKPWSHCTLTVDGDRLALPDESVYNAGLYCMPCYAFGRVVNPEADLDDGLAEAVVCCDAGAYWTRIRRGVRLTDVPPHIRARRFRSAEIESSESFQVDGDHVSGTAIQVRVEARALRLIVPGRGEAP
jgi:diacylglycerol kinase family enzyme